MKIPAYGFCPPLGLIHAVMVTVFVLMAKGTVRTEPGVLEPGALVAIRTALFVVENPVNVGDCGPATPFVAAKRYSPEVAELPRFVAAGPGFSLNRQ